MIPGRCDRFREIFDYKFFGAGVAPGDASGDDSSLGAASDAAGLAAGDDDAAGVGLAGGPAAAPGAGDADAAGVGEALGLYTVGMGEASAGVACEEGSGDSVVAEVGIRAVPTPYSYTSLPPRLPW